MDALSEKYEMLVTDLAILYHQIESCRNFTILLLNNADSSSDDLNAGVSRYVINNHPLRSLREDAKDYHPLQSRRSPLGIPATSCWS